MHTISRLSLALLSVLLLLAPDMRLYASGFPPFGFEDSATVFRGDEVAILDSGNDSVLDNDFDFERDPLTAILTRDVRHGELTLNNDGTFLYRHNGNNRKDDEFRYRAFDGTGFSRETRVRIQIVDRPNSPPFVVGNPGPQEAIAQQSFSLPLAQYFDDNDDGDVLRFSATGLPNSGSLRIDSSSGILSGTPVNGDVRNNAYNVRIIATDNGNASVSLNFDLRIFPDNRSDISVDTSLVVNPVTVQESPRWQIEVRNRGPADVEDGELQASWATSGPSLTLTAPSGCTIQNNASANPSASCSLDGMPAETTRNLIFDGNQSNDGDSTLIAVASADDPILSNNADSVAGQVIGEFSEGPTQILDMDSTDTTSGDFNGDGEIDVVVTGNVTRLFFNTGNREVESNGQSLGGGSGGSSTATLDWNGDGMPDIAVGGLSSRDAEIFLNDGDGEFDDSIRINDSRLGNVLDVAAADLDMDGMSELVIAGSGDTAVAWRSGNQGYDLRFPSVSSSIDLGVADVNQDTFPDIVAVETDRDIVVLVNSGNGTSFSRSVLDHGSVASVTPADMNGDGFDDLLVAIDGSNLTVPTNKLLLRQSGSFVEAYEFGASEISELLAGDIDGDSVMDVVAINDAGVHQLYRGRSGGSIQLAPSQIVSAGMRRGVLVDFNSDQSVDLIMAGEDVVEIHANNGIGRLGLGDRVAPTITLAGGSTISVPAGQPYVEEGVTAIDDIDGDISDQIETSGDINTTVVGSFTLSYSVADRAGNVATATRTVNVGVNSGVGGGGGLFGAALVTVLGLLILYRRRQTVHVSPTP